MIKTMMTTLAASLLATTAFAGAYEVTVTNNLKTELLAPILITDANNDNLIFRGSYVTEAAEEQILTGDPAKLAERIGARAPEGHRGFIAHVSDGPSGILLAPGESLVFTINTDAESVRVLAMVAPTEVPDNYVTTVVNLKGDSMGSDNMGSDNMMAHGGVDTTVGLDRYDIGHDEGTKTITPVATNVATIKIVEQG